MLPSPAGSVARLTSGIGRPLRGIAVADTAALADEGARLDTRLDDCRTAGRIRRPNGSRCLPSRRAVQDAGSLGKTYLHGLIGGTSAHGQRIIGCRYCLEAGTISATSSHFATDAIFEKRPSHLQSPRPYRHPSFRVRLRCWAAHSRGVGSFRSKQP